jgi:hypothetical protein
MAAAPSDLPRQPAQQRLRLGGARRGQFARRQLAPESGRLAAPEGREVTRAPGFRVGAQRRERARGERKLGAASLIGQTSRMRRLMMPYAGRPVIRLVSAVAASVADLSVAR